MKFFKKTVITLLFLGTSLIANDSTSSLVGVELGASNIKAQRYNSSATLYNNISDKIGNIGLKIGAETKNYRLFLNIKSYLDSGIYDYLLTYGVEGQYLFNITPKFNLFLGLEGGMVSGDFKLANESFSRTISDKYIGGDIGLNLHLYDYLDMEFGTRVLSLDIPNTKNNITYKHNRLLSLYMSLIYKYQID